MFKYIYNILSLQSSVTPSLRKKYNLFKPIGLNLFLDYLDKWTFELTKPKSMTKGNQITSFSLILPTFRQFSYSLVIWCLLYYIFISSLIGLSQTLISVVNLVVSNDIHILNTSLQQKNSNLTIFIQVYSIGLFLVAISSYFIFKYRSTYFTKLGVIRKF